MVILSRLLRAREEADYLGKATHFIEVERKRAERWMEGPLRIVHTHHILTHLFPPV